jgi:hypothetical protein
VIFVSAKSFVRNDHNKIARAPAEILRDEADAISGGTNKWKQTQKERLNLNAVMA